MLTRITVRLLAVAIFLLALAGLTIDLAADRRIDLANALLEDNVLSVADRPAVKPRTEAPWVAGTCRRDVVRSGGFIATSELEAIVRTGRADAVVDALKIMEEDARRVLRCDPGDGLAWAWYGVAGDELRNATEADIRRRFELSLWQSPSELATLAVRLGATARIRSRRGAAFDDLVRADLRTLFLSETPAAAVARIVAPIYVWIEPIAQQEFAVVTDDLRRTAYLNTFGAYGANIGNCDPLAFHDWLFRDRQGVCGKDNRIPDFSYPATKTPPRAP